METKETLRLIKELGELETKCNLIREKLDKTYPFDGCMHWGVQGVYTGCTVKDGDLYDSCGNELSNDGCMDEEIPYFVNQCTGYCEDDYYGTMYVKVDDENTFVAIAYEC